MYPEAQSDSQFRAALEARHESLRRCIRDLIPIPERPEHLPDRPGEHNPFPPGDVPERKLGECIGFLDGNWELVEQFGEPSAEGAQDRAGNLYNTKTEGMARLIPEPEPDQNEQSIRARINNELDGWNGDARDVADWSFGDLTTAIACQVEVMESLGAAMDLHWSLLCSARSKILLICDRAIRKLQAMDDEQEDEIGTLLKEAWQVTSNNLAKIDFSQFMAGSLKKGPVKAASEPLTDLLASEAIGLAEVVINEITDFSDEDPMPTLRDLFDKVRQVRKATQHDSGQLAVLINKLKEFTEPGGDNYKHMVHENGPVQPPYPVPKR